MMEEEVVPQLEEEKEEERGALEQIEETERTEVVQVLVLVLTPVLEGREYNLTEAALPEITDATRSPQEAVRSPQEIVPVPPLPCARQDTG